MTRDEWCSLPSPLALRVLWDALGEGTRNAIQDAPAPQVPPAPKWDTMLFSKGGIVWASECDVSQLRYYRDRAAKNDNPAYAEQDAKRIKALNYWIEYRAYMPNTQWTGERNRQTVSAAAPSARPRVYDREQRDPQPQATTSSATFSDDAPSGGAADDDIPF